jgi:hypothetical protein
MTGEVVAGGILTPANQQGQILIQPREKVRLRDLQLPPVTQIQRNGSLRSVSEGEPATCLSSDASLIAPKTVKPTADDPKTVKPTIDGGSKDSLAQPYSNPQEPSVEELQTVKPTIDESSKESLAHHCNFLQGYLSRVTKLEEPSAEELQAVKPSVDESSKERLVQPENNHGGTITTRSTPTSSGMIWVRKVRWVPKNATTATAPSSAAPTTTPAMTKTPTMKTSSAPSLADPSVIQRDLDVRMQRKKQLEVQAQNQPASAGRQSVVRKVRSVPRSGTSVSTSTNITRSPPQSPPRSPTPIRQQDKYQRTKALPVSAANQDDKKDHNIPRVISIQPREKAISIQPGEKVRLRDLKVPPVTKIKRKGSLRSSSSSLSSSSLSSQESCACVIL